MSVSEDILWVYNELPQYRNIFHFKVSGNESWNSAICVPMTYDWYHLQDIECHHLMDLTGCIKGKKNK